MFTHDQMWRMRTFLKDKLRDSGNYQGVNIRRGEVEEAADKIGLTPEESIRLFEGLKGAVWQGDYDISEQRGWAAARVTFVR